MTSQFAFLCEAVNISQTNLFNVLGGGIENITFNQLPQSRHLSLLMRIEYSISESGQHSVEIRIIDSDGQDKMQPTTLSVHFSPEVKFFNFIARLVPQFDHYGMHSVEVTVDKHSISSIPLNILQQIS